MTSVSMKQLFSTKRMTLGLMFLALYYCLINLVVSGILDYPNVIMGLTFLGCALINARDKPRVISGILVGFIGMTNILAISNVLEINTAWMLSLVCIVLVGLLEFTSIKFGPASKQAKDAAVVPMLSLFVMFILGIIGITTVMAVDYATAPIKFINYIFLMFLTGLLSFQFLGWKIIKKNQATWTTILAIICVVLSAYGVYQGTLSW